MRETWLVERLDGIEVAGSKRPAMPHGEVLASMIGLLCLGKGDYAAIEACRHEAFFARSLGIIASPVHLAHPPPAFDNIRDRNVTDSGLA